MRKTIEKGHRRLTSKNGRYQIERTPESSESKQAIEHVQHALQAFIRHRGVSTAVYCNRTTNNVPPPKEGLRDPVESFRNSWGQAQHGELLTEEEFWTALHEDD